MAEPAEKVEITAQAEGETKETVETDKAEEITKEEGDTKAPNPDEYQPEERKRPWANRQERAEFFKKKNDEGAKEEGDEPAADAEPDIPDLVRKAVDQALSPIQQQLADREDDQAVKDFLTQSTNAERFGKYEGLVRKAMKVYTNVPVGNLFKQFAFDDAEKIGAEKQAKAVEQATRRGVRGTTVRKSDSGLPDFRSMTPKQIDEFNREVSKGKTYRVEE